MGGVVLGILVWQEGGESVFALIALGAASLAGLVFWLRRRKRQGKATLLDPDLFKSKIFAVGLSQQLLQRIALGGMMITLPIYLKMVLEYNALEAGLSLAPLSLTMFGAALGALAAEQIADLAPDQDERGRDERLERDRRLDAAHGRVEVPDDGRDRHVHQRRVDDEDEHRHRQQDREPWAAGSLLGEAGARRGHPNHPRSQAPDVQA
jgi:LPXTG-motif cell wall-anchored protein